MADELNHGVELNADTMDQPGDVHTNLYSHGDLDRTLADAKWKISADIMEQLAGIQFESCSTGDLDITTPDATVKMNRDTTDQQADVHTEPCSDGDVDSTRPEASAEMNADIMEQLVDVTIQPSANHDTDIATANTSGEDISDIFNQLADIQIQPSAYIDADITTANTSQENISDTFNQLANIQIQPSANQNVDITTANTNGENISDIFNQLVDNQIQPSANESVDITTANTNEETTSDTTERPLDQTKCHLQDDADSTTTNASVEMNEDTVERLNDVHTQPLPEPSIGNSTSTARTYHDIRDYFKFPTTASSAQPWLALPELPTAVEVGSFIGKNPATLEYVLRTNKIDGPWENKQEYLKTHYELLREDAVAPLRDAVQEFHAKSNMMERDSKEHAGIYEKVYIKGLTFAQQGIAVRVGFSLRRAEKLIRWEQSKRLTSGTIVALTHAHDKFDKVCKIAVVAARPLIPLYQDPPTVELFFNSTNELELDPLQEWIMVEARSGYYEANRHTLLALQKMSIEKFPLAEHIVSLETDVQAPQYVIDDDWKELSPALSDQHQYFGVNILEEWPELPNPNLDKTQLGALRRILTKRLAVVQGPPGTGKTHVSVVALKIMRGNMSLSDPPIIVTAQTNHALDQLLRHISEFEPNFVRLGGRTVDQVVIKPRTLFEIRKASNQGKHTAVGPAMKARLALSVEIRKLLDPLVDGNEPLTAELLRSYGLLSQAQLDSLVNYAIKWKYVPANGVPGLIAMWLDEYLIPATIEHHDDYSNMELEEADLAFEQLKEPEAETGTASPDDDIFELLRGEYVALVEPWTGSSAQLTDAKIEELLRCRQDLWRIPAQYRGSVYCYLQKKAKAEMRKRLRLAGETYTRLCQNLKVAKWERDQMFLREARIIGMTTTGLSKYRGLIASLKPEVVLIEEAAETIEAHVTAACFESLQHLILVGDHQQLRGHCAIPELEGHPWNLAVSMFERLIRNRFEFSQLTKQRRMRPEIRRIINPIYPQLRDHPCVHTREDVPGMGGINSWFFSHRWYESNDNHMSKRNLEEADMVVGLFDYLVHNGMDVKDITVLTFYNGQRRKILQGLKKHRNFQGNYNFKVATVDSYQGEENEVVLLSLVRNNPSEIGFLSIANRVCVALSRARRGFYLFGNHLLLSKASSLWYKVLKVMDHDPPRIGTHLPITCTNHSTRENLTCASDWDRISGGCKAVCGGVLACGHACPSACHPFPHAHIKCQEKCAKIMAGCRHRCLELCCVQPCRCPCGKRAAVPPVPFQFLTDDPFVTKPAPAKDTNHSNLLGIVEGPATPWEVPKQARGPTTIAKDPRKRTVPESKAGGASIGTPRHRAPRQVSGQIQAWGDFAAGGHVASDKQMQASRLEKAAEADMKRQADKERKRADAENERNLFGGEEPAQTDETAATGGGEAEVDTPVTVRRVDFLVTETRMGGSRVRRVEEWRPASPTTQTKKGKEKEEVEEMSLLDLDIPVQTDAERMWAEGRWAEECLNGEGMEERDGGEASVL